MEQTKLHIALVPFPAQGHIPPLIHLARKLAANGFIITLINIDSVHRTLSQQWTSSPGLDIRLAEVPCNLSMPHGFTSENVKDLASGLAAIERLEVPVTEVLRSLEPRPCCLVADYFMSWSARVAKSLNLCPVTYWPGNAAWSWLHQHFRLLASRGDAFQEETDELRDKVITYVPGIDSLKFEDLPDYFRSSQGDMIQHFLLEITENQLRDSEWTLVNSMMELEPQTFKAMQDSLPTSNFVSVGPLPRLSKSTLRDEDEECLRWLDTQAENSVLYISFGSLATLPGKAFEELTAGLEASKQPFLLVMRTDLVQGSEKEEKLVNRTLKRGLIVSWAPQVQVLSHCAVGGFLSHCGWNSVFESIYHGVPILGWPLVFEQNMNCKLVAEDWGVGKWFSKQQLKVGRKQVEEKIREFMRGDDMVKIRSRVRDLSCIAQRTVSEGGTSYTNLDKFMTAIKER